MRLVKNEFFSLSFIAESRTVASKSNSRIGRYQWQSEKSFLIDLGKFTISFSLEKLLSTDCHCDRNIKFESRTYCYAGINLTICFLSPANSFKDFLVYFDVYRNPFPTCKNLVTWLAHKSWVFFFSLMFHVAYTARFFCLKTTLQITFIVRHPETCVCSRRAIGSLVI